MFDVATTQNLVQSASSCFTLFKRGPVTVSTSNVPNQSFCFVLFFWIMTQDDPHGPISYLSETSSSPLFVYVGTNDLRLITIFL